MIPVARLACAAYSEVARALRDAFEILARAGAGPFAGRGESLLVKPNLLAPFGPDSAVTTHPAVVDAALAVASDLGARAVVGDSPAIGSVHRAARASGIAEACRRHGVALVDLGDGGGVEVSTASYRSLRVAREALEATWLWNLPKWKTHSMTGLTLGVKNLFGCVPGKKKIAAHFRTGSDGNAFARQLLALEEVLHPCLTILDGVVAMDGPGPSRGRPLARKLLLASPSTLGLDWEAARLSGFDPRDVPTVNLSIRQGRLDPLRVRVEGAAADPMRFEPPPGSPCDWPIPRPLKRLVRGVVSRPPRFGAAECTGCGVCIEACPAGALRPGTPPEISQGACIRCYCCQELCPSGAVRIPPRGLAGWAAAFERKPR